MAQCKSCGRWKPPELDCVQPPSRVGMLDVYRSAVEVTAAYLAALLTPTEAANVRVNSALRELAETLEVVPAPAVETITYPMRDEL